MEYKYIIPCWIGVVFGMVGLICGEVWGFGERESGHLVCRKILRRKDERKKALKTLSIFEDFLFFITDLKIN